MGTATASEPTTKSVAKRTRAQKAARAAEATDAPAGGQASTGSTGLTLSSRLAAFGFSQNPDWSDEILVDANALLESWEEDLAFILSGAAIESSDRIAVPDWLNGWEAATPELVVKASELGKKAADNIDMTSEHCPYPIDTALAAAWHDAFESAVNRQDRADTNAVQVATVQKQKASDARQADEKAQQDAINRYQAEIEDAGNEAADLEGRVDELKSELKEVKAAFDDASLRSRKAARKLSMARRGFFDRPSAQKTLPGIPAPYAGDSHQVDQPRKPAVDEGAFVSLDHLVKGDLQEFIPGTPEDRGISQKQADNLKELVNGETIGDLEKWMKAKGDWWAKEMKDSGKGFGKETVTKIQDAHEVIRRKFPIPDPDDAQPVAVVGSADASVHKPMDSDDAIDLLDEIVEMCDEVIGKSLNSDGQRFAKSVKAGAESMIDGLERKAQTSPDQTRCILDWKTGITAWHEGLEREDEEFDRLPS